jgi:hypothetical protein
MDYPHLVSTLFRLRLYIETRSKSKWATQTALHPALPYIPPHHMHLLTQVDPYSITALAYTVLYMQGSCLQTAVDTV